jgi:Putative Ig domain
VYKNNGNGTATLSGTPTSTGTYPLTITAKNSIGTAVQTFTLTVS